MHQNPFSWGLRTVPAVGAYDAPQTPQSAGEEETPSHSGPRSLDAYSVSILA